MSEKKDPTFKLTTKAKEFVPKERKSVDKAEEGQKPASVALNPAAKEFVPKLASPKLVPGEAPAYPVPAVSEGTRHFPRSRAQVWYGR